MSSRLSLILASLKVVEPLSSKLHALGLIPNATKKRKRGEKKKG
jgi:hypothetical protein